MTWFLSSQNNGDLSLTIKGFLVSILPLIITILQLKGIQLSEESAMVFIDEITAGVSAMMIIWGLVRKVINYIDNRKKV